MNSQVREHRIRLDRFNETSLIIEVAGECDGDGKWAWRVTNGWTERDRPGGGVSRQRISAHLFKWAREQPYVIPGLREAIAKWEEETA
jgi:hypothetical protein